MVPDILQTAKRKSCAKVHLSGISAIGIFAIVMCAPGAAHAACGWAPGAKPPSGSVTTHNPAIRTACYLTVSAKNPILEPALTPRMISRCPPQK